MRKLIAQRYLIRQNILSIIGICLCVYFSYHAVFGNRSYIRLASLESQIETLSDKRDELAVQRTGLEDKVVMLRPGSVDRDLLEERARYVLGYHMAGEITIIEAQ